MVWPIEGVADVTVTLAPYHPRQPPRPGTEVTQAIKVLSRDPILFRNREWMVLSLCWEELVADEGLGSRNEWHGSSGDEEWTVAATKRLLIPGHSYELALKGAAQLVRVANPVGAAEPFERRYTFTAGRAPDWANGLVRAIEGVYPDDGRRPVFRDYDLVVHFKDDYVDPLYTFDKRALGVRLRDANGNVVAGADGRVLIPTQWREGPIVRSPVERWWTKARATDACEGGAPPKENGQTVLPITLRDLALLPQTRYVAELVAVDRNTGANPTEPLALWSFTTSRFHTFHELASPPARVPPFALLQASSEDRQDFDALIRSFGAAVVGVVDRTRMTPVRARDLLAYLLVEAPEPLDDDAVRLTVKVDGTVAKLLFNLDRTRVIVIPPRPITLSSPTQTVDVDLAWLGAPDGAPVEARRTISGTAIKEVCQWRVPLAGLW
jgi:hypothetical protein